MCTRNKMFCEHRRLFRVFSALCDLQETFIGNKILRKLPNFSLNVCFAKLSFVNIYPSIIFPNYPNYDVISEVNCVLLRRRPRFDKSSPMWPSTLYPSHWSVFRARNALFGRFETLWDLPEKSPAHIFKTSRFLSLKFCVDVPVLFTLQSKLARKRRILLLTVSVRNVSWAQESI